MNKYSLVSLSVAGGLLSGLAWTPWCTGLVLLFSFVPFFLIENYLYDNPRRYSPNSFFTYIIPGFVIFSITSMGWMRVASLTGAICVIMGLSFLMAFTMWLAHIVRLRAGNVAGLIAIFAFWLAYEYITLNVSIISPWINLGNGLAKEIWFIQWYEVTGTSGGTIWILGSNILLTYAISATFNNRRRKLLVFSVWLLTITIPASISEIRYKTFNQEAAKREEVVIVQPNVDPYTEKFTTSFDEQLKEVIHMADTSATGNTKWIITPETTIDDPVNLDDIGNDKYVNRFKMLASHHPGAAIISGMVTYRRYPPSPEAPTPSARITDNSACYTDHFNSAVKIDTSGIIEYYHKSKLVPGIEMQFADGPTRFISRILPYLGGTKWGFGIQKERLCFTHPALKSKVAPVICYESVFGKYITGYIKNGAGAIFIITNDGWWKNSDGYNQHLSFASLRAIETRRPVVRAGNTGISCLIDARGKITQKTGWWTKEVLKGDIYPAYKMTPYVRYGDYLMYISLIISIIILIYTFIFLPIRKKIF